MKNDNETKLKFASTQELATGELSSTA